MAGQGTILGYTFAQLARIIELVEDKERVGVCLDTCHALGRRAHAPRHAQKRRWRPQRLPKTCGPWPTS